MNPAEIFYSVLKNVGLGSFLLVGGWLAIEYRYLSNKDKKQERDVA